MPVRRLHSGEAAQSDYAAYRAAGQAVGALWQGVRIRRLGIEGVVVIWPERPGRSQVLADTAIWLTGVAAVDGYRFGRCASYERATYWRFDDDQRIDLATAARLAEMIDPDGCSDVLFGLWRLSLALMTKHWTAIESIAMALQRRRRVTGTQVEDIAASRLWFELLAGQ
jgi:hypothetical protein